MPATPVDSPPRLRLSASTAAPRARIAIRTEPVSPEELAVRAQAGSLEAFSSLVGIFHERLFNFLVHRTPSASDAEDLTQEAFIRAWQRIGTYSPKWRFSTWLFTIALRQAASEARRVSRRTQPLGETHEAPTESDGAAMMRGEARSRIWQLVADLLTHDQQTAVWLRYVEDLAISDIAAVTGRSQVAVRVMLFRARNVLAAAMSRDGERRSEPHSSSAEVKP